MAFTAPVVSVLRFEVVGTDVLTHIEGDLSPYGPPLAPAGLYDLPTQGVEYFQLHKLESTAERAHTFRTFKCVPPTGPDQGLKVVFRPWWTTRAWNIVTDRHRVWQFAQYLNDGSHAHCELTYAPIGANEAQKDGYFSGNDWITTEAYERFVRDDEYHCRDDA